MNKIHLALCMAIVICAVNFNEASPLVKRNEAAEAQKCKDICNSCSCVGFYCGDECICECNKEDEEDISCVDDMQNNCEKMHLPYEVLIQGPSGSRFVRSLLQEEGNSLTATNPKKRSTISVFKPDTKESAPAAEIESADKVKADEPAQDDVKEGKINVDQPTEAEKNIEVKTNEEKTKRDVADDKEDSKSNAEDKAKTDEKADEGEEAKKEESPEEPKKSDESTDKPSKAEKDVAKKLKKRDADEELQETVGPANAGAPADDTKEPTVGLALPIVPPLIALKTLPIGVAAGALPIHLAALRSRIDLHKGLLEAKFAPLHARVAALKAGLGLPLLPIV